MKTPRLLTASGRRFRAPWILFCTCTWATSTLVPGAKVSVIRAWPDALLDELM
ncbi:hypothetical protein D3C71_1605440 [compost metagenome]